MKHSSFWSRLCVSTMAIALTGCTAIGTKYPTLNDTTDPLQYLKQYVAADERGLINPSLPLTILGLTNIYITKDYPDHTHWKRLWCGDRPYTSFLKEVYLICSANGGNYQENGWCVNPKTNDHLFKVNAYDQGRFCTGTGVHSSLVEGVFPRAGTSYKDPTWVRFVEVYKRAQVKIKLEDQEANAVEKRLEEDAARAERLDYQTRIDVKPGQLLCRYNPMLVDKKFDVSKGILVKKLDSQTYIIELMSSNPSMPKTIKSQNASDWYLCDHPY